MKNQNQKQIPLCSSSLTLQKGGKPLKACFLVFRPLFEGGSPIGLGDLL